ncbi:hypothetical protein LZ31DRAFT_150942 [Colletotrichum somersetense]|nr:hypothetical protein LZ31DRAFT_150942 [Colletotrichum somersetense]
MVWIVWLCLHIVRWSRTVRLHSREGDLIHQDAIQSTLPTLQMHRTASEPYYLSKLRSAQIRADPDRSQQIRTDPVPPLSVYTRPFACSFVPPRRASLRSRRVPSRAFAQILASHFRGLHPILGVLIMFPPRLPNCSPDPFIGLSTPDRTRYLLRTANSNPLLPPLAHGGMHADSVTNLDLRICFCGSAVLRYRIHAAIRRADAS